MGCQSIHFLVFLSKIVFKFSSELICSPSKITRTPFDYPIWKLRRRMKRHNVMKNFFDALEFFFYFILKILEIYQIEARKAWVTLFDISFIHVESNLAQWAKKGLSWLTDENFVRKFPAQIFLHVWPAFRIEKFWQSASISSKLRISFC